ncbi:MAG: hypothetical protein LBH57_08820 [Treponema sp.]|nr:hypothetical protein [Treponema sp.]
MLTVSVGRAPVLSERGDLTEAAARLFEMPHELDGSGASRIRAELVPARGPGPAVYDRVIRQRLDQKTVPKLPPQTVYGRR